MNDSSPKENRYWAFISYSNKDGKFARWLHKSIEEYGIPVQFVSHKTPVGEPAPRRFRPLFHDRSELPASADLGSRIEEALRASHYLIVVCSPQAARSSWVNKEIETFQRFGRQNHILSIIVDGQPHAGGEQECFPPALLSVEPIAADARPSGDGRNNAKLKLLAGMLGVSFDALKQRDSHRRMRRTQLAFAVSFLLMLAFAGLAGVAWWQRRVAEQQRKIAVERTGSLRTVLSGLLWKLTAKIEALPGALGLKEEILDAAGDELSQLKTEEPADDGLSREVAVTYGELGMVKSEMGQLTEARDNLDRALSIDRILVEHDSTNGIYALELAGDLGELGAVYLAQGKPDIAVRHLANGLAILQNLNAALPIHEGVQREMARIHLLSALTASESGSSDEARLEFTKSEQLYESLVQTDPKNLAYLRELDGAYFQMTRFYRLVGDLGAAHQYLQKAQNIFMQLANSGPGLQSTAAIVSATGMFEMAETLLARGSFEASATDVADAIAILQEVRKTDPHDALAQLGVAQGQILQAKIHFANNALPEATARFLEAAQNAKQLIELDPTNAAARAAEATAYGELAIALRKSGRTQDAHRYAQECLVAVNAMRQSGQTLDPSLRHLLGEMENQDVN